MRSLRGTVGSAPGILYTPLGNGERMLQNICPYPTQEQIDASDKPIALDTETEGETRDTNIPVYFSWAARDFGSGAGPLLTPEGFEAARRLCENSRPKICHNLKFDAQCFDYLGFNLNGELHDTTLLHVLLDEHHLEHHRLKALSRELLGRSRSDEYVMDREREKHYFTEIPQELSHPYAVSDAEDALELFYLFAPQVKEIGCWDLYRNEVAAALAYKRIEQSGVGVDLDALTIALGRIDEALTKLSEQIYAVFDEQFLISSAEQLGDVLVKHFPLLERTATGQVATSKKILEPFKSDSRMQLVLAFRFLFKSASTLRGYYRRVREGRVHPEYRQTTTTGRSAAKDPPVQQIPKQRGRITEIEVGSKELAQICADAFRSVRAVFIPSPGAFLLAIDYSQIEFCAFVHYTGSKRLAEAVVNGTDIHRAICEMVFGTYDDRLRHITKMLNYGILYGMSVKRAGQQLAGEKLGDIKVEDIIPRYERAIPEMRGTQKLIQTVGEMRGYVKDIFSRRYRYAEHIGSYTLVAWLCQGTVANMKKHALVRCDRLLEGRRSRICLDIHDELVFDLFPEDISLIPLIKAEMERFPELCVPTKVEISGGPNLLLLKKMTVEQLTGPEEPWKEWINGR